MSPALLAALATALVGAALQPRPPRRSPVPAGEVGNTGLPTGAAGRFGSVRRLRRDRPIRPDVVGAWCESLARVVRTGSTLVAAIDTTPAPSGAEAVVDRIRLSVHRGERLADALATSTASPHLNLALNVLRACALNGGPPAEPLDRAASVLRGRAADAAERRTHSAQARLSAIVMTVLPVAMLALLLATSSSTRAAVATPTGLLLVGGGVVLNLCGWSWSRRIIAGASR